MVVTVTGILIASFILVRWRRRATRPWPWRRRSRAATWTSDTAPTWRPTPPRFAHGPKRSCAGFRNDAAPIPTMIVLAQVCLAAAVALFILAPIYYHSTSACTPRPRTPRSVARSPSGRGAYSQLLDLDFDRDSGKISPEDHARMREETMTEVLAVLAEEERLGLVRVRPTVIEGGDRVERMIEEYKRVPSGGARGEAVVRRAASFALLAWVIVAGCAAPPRRRRSPGAS